ncbi:MAG: type II toxin-antitoxin system HicB family antitoxin [Methanothrix sp.]|nr:MAG: type II toxin-antitoxin system HicB family antitoxin [Methanothrix sp.]
MKFHITIERDEDGKYVAECTDLPGCLSEGETTGEAIENISEAIIGCLKSRLKHAGEKFTVPSFDQKLDISIDVTESTYAEAS